jgi:hypothetical protein
MHTKHINTLCGQNVEFFGAFAKLRKVTISFVNSLRSYVCMEHLGSHRTNFHKILYLSTFRKSWSRKLEVMQRRAEFGVREATDKLSPCRGNYETADDSIGVRILLKGISDECWSVFVFLQAFQRRNTFKIHNNATARVFLWGAVVCLQQKGVRMAEVRLLRGLFGT